MANDLLISIGIGAALKGSFNAVFGRAEKTVDALGREIDGATKRQERFGTVLQRSMARSHTNLGKAVRQYQAMGKAIDAAKRSQLSLSASIEKQRAAKEWRSQRRGDIAESAAHTAVVGGAVYKALQIFSRQEDAATDLKLTMMQADGTFGEFSKVLKQAKKLGQALPGTPEAFTRLAQALKEQGMSDKVLLGGGLENAAKLNVLMNMGQAEGGEFFMKLTEAHGLKSSELDAAADITQRAYTAYGLKKDDMFESMKMYAPSLSTLGLEGLGNYEKLMAVQGIGAQKGLEGSRFGSNFSMMLSQMSKGPQMMEQAKRGMKAEAQGILDEAGIAFEFFDKKGKFKGIEGMVDELEKLNVIKEKFGEQAALDIAGAMFGEEAKRVALIIAAKGRKGYEENIKLMKRQADLNAKIAVKTSTFSAAMEQLFGVVELTAATFGSSFAPEIKSFANTAQGFIENTLEPWIANNKGLIKGTLGVVGGLLAAKTSILILGYAFSGLISPFRSVIIGGKKLWATYRLFNLLRFSGLSKGAVILRMFGFSTKNATKMATGLGKGLGKLKGGFKQVGNAVLFLGRALFMNPIGLIIGVIAGGAYLIYKYWTPISGFFKGIWGKVTDYFSNTWELLKSDTTAGLLKIGGDILDWSPVGLFYKVFASVMDYFGVEMPDSLSGFMSKTFNQIKAEVLSWSPLEWFESIFSGAFDWVDKKLDAMANSWNSFKSWIGFGDDKDSETSGSSKAAPKAPNNGVWGSTMVRSLQGLAPMVSQATTQHNNSRVNVSFAPNITVDGGGNEQAVRKQVDIAMLNSKVEFERLFNDMMDQRQRRAYS